MTPTVGRHPHRQRHPPASFAAAALSGDPAPPRPRGRPRPPCQPVPAQSAMRRGRRRRPRPQGARELVDLGIRGGEPVASATSRSRGPAPGGPRRHVSAVRVGRTLEGAAVGQCRVGLGVRSRAVPTWTVAPASRSCRARSGVEMPPAAMTGIDVPSRTAATRSTRSSQTAFVWSRVPRWPLRPAPARRGHRPRLDGGLGLLDVAHGDQVSVPARRRSAKTAGLGRPKVKDDRHLLAQHQVELAVPAIGGRRRLARAAPPRAVPRRRAGIRDTAKRLGHGGHL